MALQDLVLSVLAFPQEWTGGTLAFNVLFLPAVDDINVPLAPGAPSFVSTSFTLEAVVVTELSPTPDPAKSALRAPVTITDPFDPATAQSLFKKLGAKFPITPRVRTPMDDVVVRKSLPPSYAAAAPFGSGRSAIDTDHDFGCGIRGKDTGATAPLPLPQISWAQVISYALRQPKLAHALGLVYQASAHINPALFSKGAWFYADFATGQNPFSAALAANPDLVRLFGARIPILNANPRSLFAVNVFPVGTTFTDPETYVEAGLEADTYSDGFARIVHCFQPDSVDAAVGDKPQAAPGTDAGIQIGWDDDEVTVWQNRQIEALRSRRDPTASSVPVALGVLGYRVDVRRKGDVDWISLESVQANINFDPAVDGIADIEPPIEPATVRALAGDNEPWLPRYFAQWRGKSLVSTDSVAYQITAGDKDLVPSILTSTVPNGLLRYGNDYEFRVRLADLTYGGPVVTDPIGRAAGASIASFKFRRFIPPKALRTDVSRSADEPSAISSISVWRPVLGYPELLFVGTEPAIGDALAADAANAKADNRVLGVNDPDVTAVRVIVEARTPAHDTTDAASLDGPFRILYSFDVPLPPPPDNPVIQTPPDPANALALNLSYRDLPDVSTLTAPPLDGGASQTVPVPRVRDLRIRLQPVATNADQDYFGKNADQRGIETHFDLRSDAGAVESNLLDTASALTDRLRAFFFQPADNVPDLLAQRLNLQHSDLTFHGPDGVRTIFGCSGALRHHLSGDHSAITFATATELLGHWIVGIRFQLNRDWTWDGLAARSFDILRDRASVGSAEIRRVVGDDAIKPSPGRNQRGVTQLVFFDAVDPQPEPGQFPIAPKPSYTIQPNLRDGISAPDPLMQLSIQLPKASRPAQTPKIASAGFALSPYQAVDNYSRTLPRDRVLWIEFAEPVLDPEDLYFGRVIGYGMDPLIGHPNAEDPVPPPPPVDSEPVRMILPGENFDLSGLNAMQPLIKATDSDRHFILPLPPGLTSESLELFGFWTYELAVGHSGEGNDKWSTAQARFGRPLRATGLQHPTPALRCSASRTPKVVRAAAPLATPFLNGQSDPRQDRSPRTSMWFLLYAQVLQADGASYRNVLLLREKGTPQLNQPGPNPNAIATTRDITAVADFPESSGIEGVTDNIQDALSGLGLNPESPLSVVAVEMLPNNGNFQDPLGRDLGQQRILRVSPLTPVTALCY